MVLKFFMPTKVFLGENTIAENAAQMKALGKKAFIATGRKSAKLNGSLKDIEEALKTNNIEYYIYEAISSNPCIKQVREAAGIARKEKADFVIGIGGGSPMDAAKAIAVLASNDVDDKQLFSGKYNNPVLPVVAVPTTAGTGSEVTQYSILTNENIQSKSSIASESIFPRIAFLDASYTEKLPMNVTANTMVDALSHSVEGYVSKKAGSLSSTLAAESMTIIGECMKSLDKEPDFETREKLLYASMLGGIVIAHTGTTALHSMGYSLTYFKEIDHGKANGLLMYEYLNYLAVHGVEKISHILGYLGLKNLVEIRKSLDTLLHTELELTASEIELFSSIAIKAANIGNTPVTPTESDLKEIIKRSFKGNRH